MDKNKFRLISRNRIAENSRFEVYFDELETPQGDRVDDFLIVRPKVQHEDYVAGICILPEFAGRIGLMKGYRHQFDADVWQAPSGFIEVDEPPEQSALRELHEETGLVCERENVVPLGYLMPDSGLIEAKVALYCARDCRQEEEDARAIQPEPGMGKVVFFERNELLDLAQGNSRVGAATIVAIYRYLHLSGQV